VGFPPDQLYSSEEIVLDLRPHWWFFARQASVLVAALVFGAVALLIANDVLLLVAAAVLVAALGWFIIRYVVWSHTEFVVTTDRLISRTGVFNQSGVDIPLDRVNNVLFQRSFFERLIGSGDLEIESAGEQGSQHFSDIRKPLQVQNEIYRQVEANENRKFDRVGRNLGGGPGAGTVSIPDEIQKLDVLRQKGIVTAEEFEAKKRELLDRM
jgi:membrane protein YdbS with pleckstrin-like domain